MWTEKQGLGMVNILDKISPETGKWASQYCSLDILQLSIAETPYYRRVGFRMEIYELCLFLSL